MAIIVDGKLQADIKDCEDGETTDDIHNAIVRFMREALPGCTIQDWGEYPMHHINDFWYGNYVTNGTYKPASGGFKMEHVKTGISVSCHSEKTLMSNAMRVTMAMREMIEYLESL